MNILDEIIAHKKVEVAQRKADVRPNELERKSFFSRECLSMKKFLVDSQRSGIIAEFKRRSPSKGIIHANADITVITSAYEKGGASGISILTDEHFFGGSSEDLLNSRFNSIPILRKDFVIDEYQVLEAKALGADLILLIAACLTPEKVRQLGNFAKALQLEVLLEVHDEQELNHVCDEIDIVGVNNRDLKTFKVDVERSMALISLIPQNKLAISESGISDVKTIQELKRLGYTGFLIGENFMKEANPAIAFASFVNQLKKELHEGKSMRNDAA